MPGREVHEIGRDPAGWGQRRDRPTVNPIAQWIGSTRLFMLLAPHVLPPADLVLHRLSGGRWMCSQLVLPTLVLITTGRRSGLPRPVPLACFPEPGGSFLVVGSNFGRRRHPGWSANLLASPRAAVVYARRRKEITARMLTPEEKAAAGPAILSVWTVYERYAARSGRDLRVFRLTPDRVAP